MNFEAFEIFGVLKSFSVSSYIRNVISFVSHINFLNSGMFRAIGIGDPIINFFVPPVFSRESLFLIFSTKSSQNKIGGAFEIKYYKLKVLVQD